jgi:hypothetical protein
MKETFKALTAVMLFGGLITNASASGIITDVSASGPGLGIFSLYTIESTPNGYGLVRAAENIATHNPVTLTFNVEHSDDDRKPYDIEMPIADVALLAFSNFHLHISAPNAPSEVVFSSFDAANEEFGPDFSPYFTLDLPSKVQPAPFEQTGPQDLNFTGYLPLDARVNSYYSLSIPDPGVGKTYTFTITQTPTVVPEPEGYAMLLAGLGLVGFIAWRKKQIFLKGDLL